jgi:hypothetical protein
MAPFIKYTVDSGTKQEVTLVNAEHVGLAIWNDKEKMLVLTLDLSDHTGKPRTVTIKGDEALTAFKTLHDLT